jgi:DNA-binding PadR family transcriptional regulator
MARARQTELAVLCVLGVQPLTGYAVRAAIRDQLGYFWSESFGQIYPALGELERSGLVERHEGKKAGSSTFSLTSAGRARLVELLQQPDTPAPRRDGLMLRLFFGRILGPAAGEHSTRAAIDWADETLASLDEHRERYVR